MTILSIPSELLIIELVGSWVSTRGFSTVDFSTVDWSRVLSQ